MMEEEEKKKKKKKREHHDPGAEAHYATFQSRARSLSLGLDTFLFSKAGPIEKPRAACIDKTCRADAKILCFPSRFLAGWVERSNPGGGQIAAISFFSLVCSPARSSTGRG